jgi:rRNA maturation endonuclease Nob1
LLLGTLPASVFADQILKTSGYSSCLSNANVTVQALDITYDNTNKTVNFNVAGTSNAVQNITAQLNVTAYGISVYNNHFNPCDSDTYVKALCPGMYLSD